MTEVKDVMGKVVKIGDTVAFATAGRGASGFAHGVVSEFVGKMSVRIEHELVEVNWHHSSIKTVRKSGQFAIVEANDEETN